MTTVRLGTTALLITIAGPLLTACGTGNQAEADSLPTTTASQPNISTGSPAPNQQSPTTTPSAPATTSSAPQESEMSIEIIIDGERFEATLDDSAASRDLIAQLPLTLDMRDHGAVEKTGALPEALSLDGQPAGADPDVGDVGYYAPGNDLVLYYGDQSYYNGIVVLGRMEGDAPERIAQMEGTVTVSVDRLDE